MLREKITLCLLLLFLQNAPLFGDQLSIEVRYPKELSNRKINGRVYVFTASTGEPRLGPSWFRPQPFFGRDVKDLEPGSNITIDDRADGFPNAVSKLPPGKYRFQAVLDHDFYSPAPGTGVGNFYSEIKEVEVTATTRSIVLDLRRMVGEQPFRESEFVKSVVLESRLLEKFHGRPVVEKAAVVLPAGYHQHPEKRYPVFYEVSGFGGTLDRMVRRYAGGPGKAPSDSFEFIHVLLTGECKWGHHVYANSATNGPRGDALVREMIPLIDSRFRTVADRNARYVGGHSSGGWSSLWLQVNYPDTFGGLWSTAPDPVDFRDYQQTNLYAKPPRSIYFFPDGKKKPLARRGSEVMIWYPDFAKMDDVLGRGGQLRSFEAVFSPLDDQGLPARMWDRRTGTVNPEVVEAWKKYDIRMLLKREWETLGPKLKGRVHIRMGTEDSFYLEGATRLLGETLRELGSDALVSLVPGSHSSILTPSYMKKRKSQMREIFLQHFLINGQPVASKR